jgi:hypothetical protein
MTSLANPTRRAAVTGAVLVAVAWAAMLYFGGILDETFVLYPNIFHDPPDSLVLAREFMVAGDPSDFFPPLGLATILGGAVASVLCWRHPAIRWLPIAAVVTFVCCEFLFSAAFFWPRNTIMFVDPVGSHPAELLRTVAAEFEVGHWVRVVGGGVAATLLFAAAMRWHRIRATETVDSTPRT